MQDSQNSQNWKQSGGHIASPQRRSNELQYPKKIQFSLLYNRFPLVDTVTVEGDTFYVVLNRLPITPAFVAPTQRDSGIVVLKATEIPVPSCPTEILNKCGETMKYRYVGEKRSRYGLTSKLEDARNNLREKRKRDALRQLMMFTPPPRKDRTVDVCMEENTCWEMAHILGTGQVGVVSLLCDLGEDNTDRLQDVSDCNKVLKTQYLGRRFYWETYALKTLPDEIKPHLFDVWQCMAFNQGFIVEEKTIPFDTDHVFSPEDRAKIVRILDIMHRSGWVHQDLHKDNIQKRADGSIVFIDFGYSRRFPTEPPSNGTYVCVTGEHSSTLGPLTFDTALQIEQSQLYKALSMGDSDENEYTRVLQDKRNEYTNRVNKIWNQNIVQKIISLRSKLWNSLSGQYDAVSNKSVKDETYWTFKYSPRPGVELLKSRFRTLSNGEI